MTVKQFIKIAGRTSEFERRGLERIPGTDIVRTYCGNPMQYSKESDLERITSERSYVSAAKKQI